MEGCMEDYIGCCCSMHQIRARGNELTDKVLEKVNNTLELVMVNDFARETNENQFKRSLQDRMSDIASWRWVLEDLSKRLEESKAALKYELKAGNVVVQRVKLECEQHSKLASKPGCLCPKTDSVEAAIIEEYRFLKEQKTVFEELCAVVENQISLLEKTMKKIQDDILNKNETLAIEEGMADISMKNISKVPLKTKQKKKPLSLARWEKKCMELKSQGLQALRDALLTKQQVRGARVQLTIAAQTLASKVDSAIRRRIHANQIKLQEFEWQKEEATKELQALQEELLNTEQTLLANMEQERVIVARLADRTYRPNGEMTKDEVDQTLRSELARVRHFIADLRNNMDEITCLQNYIKDTMAKLECCSADLIEILKLDETRLNDRLNGPPATENYRTSNHETRSDQNDNRTYRVSENRNSNPTNRSSYPTDNRNSNSPATAPNNPEAALHTIKEEEEDDDDYPFAN